SALLVGPQGQSAVLMSGAGGSFSIANTRLAFDDAAAVSLPQFSLITNGTYKPTDYTISDTYFPPAPPAPYGKTLSVFNGKAPNGTWQLWVEDTQPGDAGVITGGWILSIDTVNMVSPMPPQTMMENTELTVPFTVEAASNLIVTVS